MNGKIYAFEGSKRIFSKPNQQINFILKGYILTDFIRTPHRFQLAWSNILFSLQEIKDEINYQNSKKFFPSKTHR